MSAVVQSIDRTGKTSWIHQRALQCSAHSSSFLINKQADPSSEFYEFYNYIREEEERTVLMSASATGSFRQSHSFFSLRLVYSVYVKCIIFNMKFLTNRYLDEDDAWRRRTRQINLAIRRLVMAVQRKVMLMRWPTKLWLRHTRAHSAKWSPSPRCSSRQISW